MWVPSLALGPLFGGHQVPPAPASLMGPDSDALLCPQYLTWKSVQELPAPCLCAADLLTRAGLSSAGMVTRQSS